jgi:hypothetical protein
LILPDNNHNNDRSGVVGRGNRKHICKEEEFEVSRSSIYKRILIVDDEPDIAMTLKIGLDMHEERTKK